MILLQPNHVVDAVFEHKGLRWYPGRDWLLVIHNEEIVLFQTCEVVNRLIFRMFTGSFVQMNQ